jgi:deoxyribodipyrimidine photo-lyase
MTAFRRLESNFALDRAVTHARTLDRPLVILEALRVDYPWASDRLHRFVLDGMAEHAGTLAKSPVAYWPYVEPKKGAGRGLLEALANEACVVVTDDYPCFFLPRMLAAAAPRLDVCLEAVDANGVLPLRSAGKTFVTARSFRAHLQRTLRPALDHRPERVRFTGLRPAAVPASVARRWPATPVGSLQRPEHLLATLPIDHTVGAVEARGGRAMALARLRTFVRGSLDQYHERQRHPDLDGTSRFSPYLHFGHLSAHDVFDAVMTHERWTTRKLGAKAGGRREGWWGVRAGAEAFLDQVLTWREVGFNMCVTSPEGYDQYNALPAWARRTLAKHARDRRAWIYDVEALTKADTHDDIWNAAQRQLVQTGWMHNYLRMLWGKKILEWSPTPEAAFEAMTTIMNRFAIDGRDPNSYSGYAWTLGRYDRAWGPERPIFGTVRYMSSDATRRKLKLRQFLKDFGDPKAEAPTPRGARSRAGSAWRDAPGASSRETTPRRGAPRRRRSSPDQTD